MIWGCAIFSLFSFSDFPFFEEGGEGENEDQEDTGKDAGATRKKGYSLIFDVARRFAQPLGIHLPEWEGGIIETEKGIVRLLSVKERAKQLFGEEGVSFVTSRIEEEAQRDPQIKFNFVLRSEGFAGPKIKGRRSKSPQSPFAKGGQDGSRK